MSPAETPSELDAWPVGCLQLSADDTVTRWNRQLAVWTGLAAADVLGRPIAGVIPAWQVAGLATAVTAVREGGEPVVLGPGPMFGAFSGDRGGDIRTQVTVMATPGLTGGVQLLVVDVALAPEVRPRPMVTRLDDSDTRFRDLSAQIPGAFYQLIFWPDGTRTVPFVSAGIDALFGLEPETLIDPAAITSYLHPDDETLFRTSFRDAAVSRSAWHCEFRVRLPDGQIRWLETRAVARSESDGSLVWNGLIHDVSDRKHAAEAQARSQALLSATVENSTEAITVVDHDRCLLVANQIFLDNVEQGSGVRLRVGESIRHDWWPEEDAREWDAWWNRALAGETFTVEKNVGTPERPVFIELCYWPVILDGRIIAASCASRNMTDRKEAADALARSQALLSATLENSPQSIWVVDRDMRLLIANARLQDRFEALTGIRLEVGNQFQPQWWPEEESQRWGSYIDRALAGESFTVEHATGAPDRPMFIELSFWPVLLDGEIIAASCASRDVTARRQTEAELQRQKELAEASTRAKSDFLATISHEIRTPLNGVLGMADLLADTPLSGEQREYHQAMHQSALTLSTLLNDLLDLSRIEAGQLAIHQEPFRLSDLIDTVVDNTSAQVRRKGLALLTDIAPHVPARMVGDGQRLRQVLLNLVNNAIKFTEEGHVRLKVGGTMQGDWLFRLELAVEDTGMGIPRDKQPLLFTKFMQADASTTRRFGGTGLGLAICRDLVRLMGGTIHLSSDVGVGTAVTVAIPLGVVSDSLPAERVAPAARAPVAAVDGCRLLVVDDNLINRRAACRILERIGATVDEAADGRSAVALVAERRYDLVFMDCQMPDLDGYEATDLIRCLDGDAGRTPIVALTAYAMAGDRERCLLAGMNDYLAKPVTRHVLEDVLRRWHLLRTLPGENAGPAAATAEA